MRGSQTSQVGAELCTETPDCKCTSDVLKLQVECRAESHRLVSKMSLCRIFLDNTNDRSAPGQFAENVSRVDSSTGTGLSFHLLLVQRFTTLACLQSEKGANCSLTVENSAKSAKIFVFSLT